MLDSLSLLTEMTDQMQHRKACRRSSELLLFSSCLNSSMCYLLNRRSLKGEKGRERTDLSSKHICLPV